MRSAKPSIPCSRRAAAPRPSRRRRPGSSRPTRPIASFRSRRSPRPSSDWRRASMRSGNRSMRSPDWIAACRTSMPSRTRIRCISRNASSPRMSGACSAPAICARRRMAPYWASARRCRTSRSKPPSMPKWGHSIGRARPVRRNFPPSRRSRGSSPLPPRSTRRLRQLRSVQPCGSAARRRQSSSRTHLANCN